MNYFAWAFKKPALPLPVLQYAQGALIDSGFTVFDPVAAGKPTLGGTHVAAGVMVTVVAMDCEGGSAVVVHGFCASDMAAGTMQALGEQIAGAISAA